MLCATTAPIIRRLLQFCASACISRPAWRSGAQVLCSRFANLRMPSGNKTGHVAFCFFRSLRGHSWRILGTSSSVRKRLQVEPVEIRRRFHQISVNQHDRPMFFAHPSIPLRDGRQMQQQRYVLRGEGRTTAVQRVTALASRRSTREPQTKLVRHHESRASAGRGP